MFDRNHLPPLRDPPGEAEIAYVRALLAPLEAKFAHLAPKPHRIFPPRPMKTFTDQQLLAIYAVDGPKILIPVVQARIAQCQT